MFLQPRRVSTGIHIVRKEKYSHRFRSRGSNRRLASTPEVPGVGFGMKFQKRNLSTVTAEKRTPLDLFLGTDTSAYYWGRLRNVIYVKGAAGSEEFLNFTGKIPFLQSLARQ